MRLDLFDFFRYALATVATIYATVVTVQSLWTWYVWLAGSDKYISIVRRYVILHGLRLRIVRFGGDLLVCLLLCVMFGILWYAHTHIIHLAETLQAIRQASVTHVSRVAR